MRWGFGLAHLFTQSPFLLPQAQRGDRPTTREAIGDLDLLHNRTGTRDQSPFAFLAAE